MRLVHALNIALVIFIVSVVSALYVFPMHKNEFIMHIFWMLASLSFGFVGAYLLEERQKSLFLSQKELKKSAITDKLTGLYNRKKFDEIIADELEKSKRYNHTFGLIMIDIDFFKNINDTYGHNAGDKVLIEIAEILNENTRSSDVSVRWGGEEFMIICLEANDKTVFTIAENIRQKVEETHFYKIDNVTISVGATISREDDDIDSIIKRADEALYKIKNGGKNSVEVIL